MNIKLFTFLLLFGLTSALLQAQGTWTALRDTAPDLNNGAMLLLTNGNIITTVVDDPNAFWDDNCSAKWNKLIPDSTGSYINGTWAPVASMANSRIYFSSWVLPNGKVYVAGGEFGTGRALAELYDPIADTWSPIPGLDGVTSLADPNSVMLPDGRILQNSVYGPTGIGILNYFYDPVSDSFSTAPSCPINDDEASWLMLPDNSILYESSGQTSTQRYIPSLNRWIPDAPLQNSLYDIYGDETGAGFVLPDGRAFFLGSNGNTAYYTPTGDTTNGTWTPGPQIPNNLGTPDAPAAMLPDGRILCSVSPVPNASSLDSVFHFPTYFYLFDYRTNSFTQIPAPGGGWSVNQPCGTGIMLNLPDGTILFGVEGSNQYYIYIPDSLPLAAGKPTIDTVTENNCQYMITGTLFNGISQGSAYGDDWQVATNYPVIRLVANGHTYFAPTTNWNRTGIQTGNLPDTAYFTVPSNVPYGTYALILSANGNSSDTFTFSHAHCVTGISALRDNIQLQVSPNPSTGVFNISIPGSDSNYTLQVYNAVGQKVKQLHLSGEENTIDLSVEPAGLYLLYLQTSTDIITAKAIVGK